jgi:hypothetical protein
MTTLEFAANNIVFNRSGSPITGPFRIEQYPFLRAPFAAADDIRVKRLVLYKASSSMGTVAGQCIMAKRVLFNPGDMLFCAQSDDDAATWCKTRGKEFLLSIPNVRRFLSRDKYSVTNDLFQFRGKFLAITGPGISSAQSLQVSTLMSDEAHLDSYPPGRLIEFEKRLGGRWNRLAVHVTTAPDVGKEVDTFFNEGQKDNWNFRCPKCANLTEPSWAEHSKAKYNGVEVFQAAGDNVLFICPHCQASFADTARERFSLVKDGDYIAENPSAPFATRSFRWPVFAMHTIAWSGLLAEHRAAMESAKLGNLKPHEDWIKKRECRPYSPSLPDFGGGKGVNDYKLGDVWETTEEKIRILSADFQAGSGDEGAHLHALCVEYDRLGNSRRIEYRRLDTFEQLHQMALTLGVREAKVDGNLTGKGTCVIVDSGHENRLVFRECSKYGWYAYRGSDLEQFHVATIDGKQVSHPMPYSVPKPESGIVGEKQPDRLRGVAKGALPAGWAYCIVGDNNTLYGYLSALVGGSSGRYFGIASDMPEIYVANMPAFIPLVETDKKTNKAKATVWKRVRKDHFWDCEVMALTLAMKHGFFPLAITKTQETK